MSIENEYESRNSDKILYRKSLAQFAVDFRESDPQNWWQLTASYIRKINRLSSNFQTAELRSHLKERVGILKQSLRDTIDFSKKSLDQFEIAEDVNNVIMKASMKMAEPFCAKEEDIHYQKHTLDWLCGKFPDYFSQQNGVLNNTEVIFFTIKNPNTKEESVLPCPINKKFWHKGGGPRYVADVVTGSPQIMKDSELPCSDLDALTAESHKEGYNLALSMGVDPNGVEYSSSDSLNPIEYFQGRDTTQNQVLLGADGFYISEYAKEAAQTGHVAIVGEITAGKAIYNVDKVVVGELELVKPRGLFRLIKVVAEGKAVSFDYLPVNSNFDVSLYMLYLAKKFSGKERFSDKMQKVFYLMKQMGQVLPTDINIYQVLERAHTRYPFFDFQSEISDSVELAKWKVGKIVKQADREARWQCKLPNDLVLKRFEGDLVNIKISLKNYEYQTEPEGKMDDWWFKFLERSDKRTKAYSKKQLNPIDLIFNKADMYDLSDSMNSAIPDMELEM